TTLLPRVPLWVVLIVSTSLFVCLSGRMIPGMALVASAADPARRGTFMVLNAAVQSAAMGAASLIGGLIISRDAAGQVERYGWTGVIGCLASLGAIALARRLRLHGATDGPARQT
ncbi:MAG: MFS transporter, partial [Hydrogenophaga sp.]|nr:MFS transporter [Hydrogenophaga sp.]